MSKKQQVDEVYHIHKVGHQASVNEPQQGTEMDEFQRPQAEEWKKPDTKESIQKQAKPAYRVKTAWEQVFRRRAGEKTGSLATYYAWVAVSWSVCFVYFFYKGIMHQ